jgi:hypothetical protein
MPFNYAKIEGRSAGHSQDDLEQTQIHAEYGRSTMWSKIHNLLTFLRWPTTFFLLFVILICQLSIWHMQPVSSQIGGELNGLVPHCKLLGRDPRSTRISVDLGPLTSRSLEGAETLPLRRTIQLRPPDNGVDKRDQEELDGPHAS